MTNLIHFDPIGFIFNKFDQVWSSLNQFEQVWSSLNQFNPFGSNLITLSMSQQHVSNFHVKTQNSSKMLQIFQSVWLRLRRKAIPKTVSEGWLAVKKKCYWKSDAPSLKNVGQAVQTLFQLEENFSIDCNGTLYFVTKIVLTYCEKKSL